MIVVCCVCKKFIKEKAPLENTDISHSYCDICLEDEFKKIDKGVDDETKENKEKQDGFYRVEMHGKR